MLWEPQKPGDSIVIMVPGAVTGAAMAPVHDYDPLATLLTENGYAFLLSKMRASYSYPYSEYADAVKDIAAFVSYVKSKGYTRIAILGISPGGPRHYLTPGPLAEAYARETTDRLVKNMPAAAR